MVIVVLLMVTAVPIIPDYISIGLLYNMLTVKK